MAARPGVLDSRAAMVLIERNKLLSVLPHPSVADAEVSRAMLSCKVFRQGLESSLEASSTATLTVDKSGEPRICRVGLVKGLWSLGNGVTFSVSM